MSNLDSGTKAVATFLAMLFAIVIYGTGLIAPLTPSKGMPSAFSMFGFWILPMMMLGAVLVWNRSLASRAIVGLVLATVLASYAILIPSMLAL